MNLDFNKDLPDKARAAANARLVNDDIYLSERQIKDENISLLASLWMRGDLSSIQTLLSEVLYYIKFISGALTIIALLLVYHFIFEGH